MWVLSAKHTYDHVAFYWTVCPQVNVGMVYFLNTVSHIKYTSVPNRSKPYAWFPKIWVIAARVLAFHTSHNFCFKIHISVNILSFDPYQSGVSSHDAIKCETVTFLTLKVNMSVWFARHWTFEALFSLIINMKSYLQRFPDNLAAIFVVMPSYFYFHDVYVCH